MGNWAGVWIGLWEGDWEGSESGEPGVLNTGLNVAGTGTATFAAKVIGAPVQAGGVGRLIYSSLRQPKLPSTVSAGLVVTGRGSAQLTGQVGQRVDAGLAVAGTSRARLGAAVSVSAGLQASAGASSTLQPAVTVSAVLQASGTSSATFGATEATRTVVVPLRPRVELADDEIAAILYLMAA